MARLDRPSYVEYVQYPDALNPDSHRHHSLSQYAPSMRGGRDVEYDLREHITTRGGGGAGQLVQRAPTVVEEPLIEHEHHHLHHHIDHGDVNSRLGLGLGRGVSSRPNVGRQYSYDDLDVHERRFSNGTSVSEIHHVHEQPPVRERRHRHRHRSGRTSVERTRYSRSEVDLYDMDRREREDQDIPDDVTVVDVAPGTRRVYVKVQHQDDARSSRGDLRDREESVDWRREHGVRRSRGLGNELWTEITKDLVTREAIEEFGYPYEETEYFYYIFEYLDREQIAELRDLTDDIRHERVRDIEYRSIAGSQVGGANDRPRGMITGARSERGGSVYERERIERIDRVDRDFDDTRTEIIVESSGSRSGGRSRRNKYYY